MRKKRVLLTGGSGFIGRNFRELLGGEHEIFAPPRSELDLADAQAVGRYFKSNDFDAVVHAANAGGTRKTEGMPDVVEANLRPFFNIARCSESFGRMVHIGSGAEYGKSGPIILAKEESLGARIPSDAYGFYKYVCSRQIEGREGAVCIRPFGVYGKYEDYGQRFISNSICRALFGLPVTVANRNVRFSYIHVEDLCRVISHFVSHKGKHRAYNATPSEVSDLVSIGNMVNAAAGRPGSQVEVRKRGMGPEYSGDNSRLLSEIPGFRFTPLSEGVEKLCQWYAGRKGEIDPSLVRLPGE